MTPIRYLTLCAVLCLALAAPPSASAESAPKASADRNAAALTAIGAAIKSLEEKPGQGVISVSCTALDTSKGGRTTVNQELHGGIGNTHVENMVGVQASGCSTGSVEVLQNVGGQVAIDRSTRSVQILKELQAAVEHNDSSAFGTLLKKLTENGLDVLAQVLTALLLKKL